MALNFGSISSKRIPTILGLLVLIGGVIAGVVVVGQQTGFSLRAGPTATPRNVRVTNISDTSVTVSWITDTSVSGYVRYGTEANQLNRNFGDDRDQISGTTGLFTTHHVTLKALQANTEYFFKVGTGSQVYDNEGQPWQIKTARTVTRPAADPMSGKVLLGSGQPASGVVVYVEVEGGSPLSAQTKTSGIYNLSLSQMRTEDLSSFLKYEPESVRISIFAQGADLGSATAIVTGANKNPVPDITLGENLDFQTAGSTLSPPVITIQNNIFTPNELSVAPGQAVAVINNDLATHSAVARTGEFSTGPIQPNSQTEFFAPPAAGSYVFFDELFPELESLVGTLLVVPTPTIATIAEVTTTPILAPIDGFGELEVSPDATHSVKIATEEINTGLVATESPEIVVNGPVGTTVKITVRSDPQTTTGTIGADGQFEFVPPEGLEPGEHTVTIEYVDANGVTQTYTKTFTVLAPTPTSTLLAQVTPTFTASPTATLRLTPTASPTAKTTMPSTVSGIPEAGVLTPTLVLLTLGIGLFLAGIGWQLKLMPQETAQQS